MLRDNDKGFAGYYHKFDVDTNELLQWRLQMNARANDGDDDDNEQPPRRCRARKR